LLRFSLPYNVRRGEVSLMVLVIEERREERRGEGTEHNKANISCKKHQSTNTGLRSQ
jgi:hypothetical protein